MDSSLICLQLRNCLCDSPAILGCCHLVVGIPDWRCGDHSCCSCLDRLKVCKLVHFVDELYFDFAG